MKRHVIILLTLIILSSCGTNNLFQVTRVGEEPEDFRQRSVYVLPQTLMRVDVEFEKETFIPGPYRLFTEKYLGIDEYITQTGYSYRILNVDVENLTEPDPDHFYSINLLKGEINWENYFQMSHYGIILDPSSVYDLNTSELKEDKLTQTFFFTDRSVKRNLTEVTDTLYKTVIRDSSYVRIPILRSQREAKTLEQKAEEAANFIIKTRKRRFKLLAGQYELFPEGDALAISVKELDKLEKEYLELFLGKRIKSTYRRSYLFIPEASKSTQSHVLARFSPQIGLFDAEDASGEELLIELIPAGKVSQINNSTVESLKENNLYYRIPDIAEVRVRIKNDILYEGRQSIYQLGEFLNYPVIGE